MLGFLRESSFEVFQFVFDAGLGGKEKRMGWVESKARDLGSDRGYRVAIVTARQNLGPSGIFELRGATSLDWNEFDGR